MYYYDDFGKEFKDELSFHEYLEEIDERAKWIRIPSRSLSVLTVSGHEVLVPDMEGVDMKDLLADTKKHSGLLLQFPEGMYPLGKTAVSTLKDRARIKGTALMDVKKSVLADILNECLQVAKGDALLRISEGKVRGVLSGDEADYAIISMPKLFMVASAYISGDRNGEFIYGYADHNMAQITWKIVDQKMTKAYADLMEEHGKKPFGNLQTFIRIVSSDVGASGANIFYSILDGDFTIVLGEALRTKHRHKQGLEEFSENMESIFQYYKQKLRDIGKLCDIRIRYPVNALSEVMKKQSFGKKLIAETVERFKTNFGEQPCSAYEIYCGLCEALFFARKSGSSPSNLVKMEEKIARCMNVRWHDYDIPGEISL